MSKRCNSCLELGDQLSDALAEVDRLRAATNGAKELLEESLAIVDSMSVKERKHYLVDWYEPILRKWLDDRARQEEEYEITPERAVALAEDRIPAEEVSEEEDSG